MYVYIYIYIYKYTSERVWPYSVAVVPRPRLSACESYVDITVGLNLAAYCYIAAVAAVAAAAVTSPGVHHRFAIPRELAAAPARCRRAIITSAKMFRHAVIARAG